MASTSSIHLAVEKYVVGSETVVKNITKEVVRDCAKEDVFIDEMVVSMVVRLLCLDPANGLQLDHPYHRRDLETFVCKCVERLKDHSKPWIKTIWMQVFFMVHSIDLDRIIRHHDRVLEEKTHKLTNDILSATKQTPIELDKIFKKMTVDMVVNNYLGSPLHRELCVSVSAALSSILSKDQLAQFLSLKSEFRLTLLKNYRSIVCGIYIYNKHYGLCDGEPIGVASVLLNGHLTTESQCSIALDEIENRIQLLTNVLNKHRCVLHEPTEDDPPLSAALAMMQDTLIMQYQHASYVRNLLRTLAKTKAEIDHAIKAFKANLVSIHAKVEYKTAIPTNQIFPDFEDLAESWKRLQNYIFIVSEMKMVNERLLELNDEVEAWETIAMDLLSAPVSIKRETIGEEKIVSQNDKIEVIEYKSGLKIEFGGYCPICLAKGEGYLRPANYKIGICVYQNKHYAFLSTEAANDFMNNPDNAIYNVVAIARHHPELVMLLDIFDLVKANRNDFQGLKRAAIPLVTKSIEIQTEVHPVAANYDNKYVWNIWDYRRKAIQFANLLSCKTTSAQTLVGYQQYAVGTQMWSPRDATVQTRQDAGVNVPLPRRTIRGVRGTDDELCRDVKLTDYVEDDVLANRWNKIPE